MAERSVVVRIKAEYAAFKRDMNEVSRAAKGAAKDTEESGKRASTAMGRLAQDAQKNRESWDTAGTAAVGFGLVAVAAVGLAVSKYAQFEKAMSRVQAATHETSDNMGQLREAALRAGADTAFSAEEAAGAIEELAKAGVSTADILGGGLNGALSLAAAGELAVADAAEIAASAMTQFKLSGEDIPHIADLLAAGAGKAQGSVADMGAALNQAGLVASATGLTIEETTGTLAAFASAGLTGSDAGTSFKTMLQRLNPQSEAAATKMAELGISAYDAQGNFIGMEALAGKLEKGMSGLSEEARASAMNVIFGSDAVRAANVLYEQGAAGVAKWTDAVDTAGYAALTASINQDNLLGDLEKLGGAFDTVFLKSGGSANEAMRGLVQTVESLVDGIGALPVPVLETGLAIAGIAGSTALALGGILKLTPAVLDGVTAFRSLGTEGGKVPGTLGKIAKAAGIAAIAVGGLQILGQVFTTQGSKSVEEYGNALLKVSEAGEKAEASDLDSVFNGDWSSSFGQKSVEVDGMAEAIARLSNVEFGDGINRWADQAFGWTGLAKSETTQVKDRLAELGDQMGDLASNGGAEAAAESFNLLTAEFERNGKTAQDALDAMPGYRDALLGLGNAAGLALEPSELLELATGKLPDRMVAAQEATALAEAQFGTYTDAVGQAVPVSEAQAKALEEIGLAADGTVVALDKYVEALFAAGLSQMSARDATAAHQEALRENAGAIDAAREALVKQYEMEGMSAESAKALAASQDILGIALNDNKTDFDLTSAAGAALNEQFQSVAQTGMAEIEAKAKAGVGQAELQANLKSTYDSLIVTLEGMDITGEAADNLARTVLGVPDEANIDTWMSDQAKNMAQETTGAVIAVPDQVTIDSWMSEAAKLTADATKKSADDVPEQETIDSWMSDAAFMEAIRTRAAALNIPEQEAIDSFMSSAARNEADKTTAQVLGIPEGASVSSFMSNYARVEAQNLAGALNAVDGRTVNTYANFHETTIRRAHTINTSSSDRGYSQNGGVGGLAFGGRVPRRATGGRLPTSGPGTQKTDGILGVSSLTGAPTTWVDAGEWVVNAKMSDKHDSLIAAINRDDPRLTSIGGLATGGRASREYAPAPAYFNGSAPAGPMQMVGQLTMDSGEVLGTFRGIATQVAQNEIKADAASAASRRNGMR